MERLKYRVRNVYEVQQRSKRYVTVFQYAACGKLVGY